MKQEYSLFDRVISKNRPGRFLIGIFLFFAITLLGAILLDNTLEEFMRNPSWRGLMIPPTIILYILTVAPGMARMENRVLESFHEITLLDNDEFLEIVSHKTRIHLKNELAVIGFGFIIGIIAALGSTDGQFSWLTLYWILTSIAMYVLLVWTIYVSIMSTQVTSTLLGQPMKVDPFDTKPFEPIGKQSLRIALVFIGGITISLVFIGTDFSKFFNPLFWLIYIPLALVPLILFFLNMVPTHRVLANAKARELDSVRDHLKVSFRALHHRLNNNINTEIIPAEINALAEYEKHLQETRTWPYNTAMLRTLFFSILIPVGTLIGRIIIVAISD
jgi:peptidoglycan/LPS O-acetylase OafA/YrhL